MLTMTSGMSDWFDESGDWEANWKDLCRKYPIYLFRRNQDYLPLFIQAQPLFPVGQNHQYNGAGYILLGLVIESISGLSYFDYVRDKIFTPLKMHDSDFIDLDGIYPNVAEGYIRQKPEGPGQTTWLRNTYSITPSPAADGGATSTLADLRKFSLALRDMQLLSPELTTEILTPHVPQFDERVRGYTWEYGYANIFLSDENNQIIRWGHTGEEDGFSCRLYYYPTADIDVIILGNQSWCASDLAWEIHDIILRDYLPDLGRSKFD
jgi:CubicO group peptidase (beta-lactamase class C family)